MSILALVDAENWQAILDQYDTGCDIPPDDDPYWFDIADKDYFERGILAIIKIAREHVAPPPADPLVTHARRERAMDFQCDVETSDDIPECPNCNSRASVWGLRSTIDAVWMCSQCKCLFRRIDTTPFAPPPADPLARYWRECYGEPGAAE